MDLIQVPYRLIMNLQRSLTLLHRRFTLSNAAVAPFQTFRFSHTDASDRSTKAPKPFKDVPGFRSYPFLGSSVSFLFHKDFNLNRMHKFFQSCFEEFGPIFKCAFAAQSDKFVSIYQPDHVETLFNSTKDNPSRIVFSALKKIRYEDPKFRNKCGILMENDEEWWRVRSKVQGPMMKPKNVVKYLPGMNDVTTDFIVRISELQDRHGEMPKDFTQELYKYALENVALVALDQRLGCLSPDLSPDSFQHKMIDSANVIMSSSAKTERSIPFWKFFPTPSYTKLKKANKVLLQYTNESIRKTEDGLKLKENKDEEDLTLMEALLTKPGISRLDVVTLILDMFFVGIDTTSHTIAFTLYLLAKNPEVQKRLHEELDATLDEGNSPMTEAQLARLSYLKCCVKESLRIFPIALGISRTLEKDTVLAGYNILKGTIVFTDLRAGGLHEISFPKAKEFIPERWFRDRPLGQIHPYASLPFSTGTRMCIGKRIAEQEIYTLLARLLHVFRVDYKYEDMDIETTVVNHPSEPLRFEFHKRS